MTSLMALLVAGSSLVPASPLPYDERIDARAEITRMLECAKAERKPLLLMFGANWCPDCRVLASALQEPPLSDLIAAHFVVVKVDVGNWDRNQPLVKQWGNPIGKGIPAIVVVNADGGITYTTRAGELANARHMGASGLLRFFSDLVERDH